MAIDPKKIEEWRAKHAAAGDAPQHDEMGCGLADDDQAFYLAAREAVPALLAEVEQLQRARLDARCGICGRPCPDHPSRDANLDGSGVIHCKVCDHVLGRLHPDAHVM